MKFKDFYRESILRESRGEFWIDSSGGVESCDLDVNDTGHEGVILDRLMHEYTNLFDIDYERSPREDLGRYEEEIKEFLKESGVIVSDDDVVAYESDASGFTYDRYLSKLDRDKDRDRDALGLIWDLSSNIKDARDYGMKYYNDKRLVNNSIQTWGLTDRDLRVIGDGIYEAYGEEVETNEETYSIEVMDRNNRAMYWEVPWEVIASNSVSNLMMYKERV